MLELQDRIRLETSRQARDRDGEVMLTHDALVDVVERIENDTSSRLDKLGERYADEVIQPFCDEHGLKFLSGMGTNFFVDVETDKIVYTDDWEEAEEPPYIDRMIEIAADLELEVVTQHTFGEYVPDVNNGGKDGNH